LKKYPKMGFFEQMELIKTTLFPTVYYLFDEFIDLLYRSLNKEDSDESD
jgi:hypothetical protein